MTGLPQPPSSIADVAAGQELRAYIRQQKSAIDFIMKRLSNPRVLAAVLTQETFLSGLSDAEYGLMKQRARTTLHPAQADMQTKLRAALDDLRGGVEEARRMVRERCQMGEDEASNSEALADAKSAAA